ncbi:MAG: Asp-tRNA(Asn)/Glu-tRNA(Gln) amidotransferase subunit GatA [bacterium]
MKNQDLLNLDSFETDVAMHKLKMSYLDLVNIYIQRIEKLDSKYNVFITKTFDLARKQAKFTDNHPTEVYLPPYVLKDNIITRGIKTTCASKILENFTPTYNATVYNKLNKNNGILLGKVNLDEFAHGASTENSVFGPTKNPWDDSRVPGGSSGGTAAAVALRMCKIGFGSDTGGSVRQPAAFCGVVGLKPTYGLVSRYGLVAMASSMDQIGPIATNINDAILGFINIMGFDPNEATSVDTEPKNYWPILKKPKVKKIGVPEEFFGEGLDKEVKKTVQVAIDDLQKCGYKIEKISLPHAVEYSVAVYYIMQTAEVSSNLARFDGVKYGYSTHNKSKDLKDVYMNSRGQGFGEEAKRRIILGTFVLSSGYFDAYYKQAAKVRYKIKEDFDKAFEKVDVILTPTTPTLPFKLGAKTKDPLQMYMADLYTAPANLAGIPAISVPCGYVNNLPVGMQLMANSFNEDLLFDVGYNYEQSHNWHNKIPII